MADPHPTLGEFEQHVLLVVVGLGERAHGVEIARVLEEEAHRRVSRGALYATLDRLERKGWLRYASQPGHLGRDGLPRRLYSATASGLAALRASRDVLRRLWRNAEGGLKERSR